MSRVAKQAISIPAGVEVKLNGQNVEVKGPKGSTSLELHSTVSLKQEDGVLTVVPASEKDYAMAGTMRALTNNLIVGVAGSFKAGGRSKATLNRYTPTK